MKTFGGQFTKKGNRFRATMGSSTSVLVENKTQLVCDRLGQPDSRPHTLTVSRHLPASCSTDDTLHASGLNSFAFFRSTHAQQKDR